MKKKGIVGRLAAVAVVLCLVTMALTSGTLAKYASEASGNATATVAKWNVALKADGTAYDSTSTFELKLKDQAKVTDNLVADERIAPGTSGSFALAVDGSDTEVAFDYTIELDLTGLTNVPLDFYDGDPDNGGAEITPTDNKISFTGTVMVGGTAATEETIYWKWNSTGIGSGATEDERDTALGEVATTFTIPVKIHAEQRLEAPASP